MVMGMYFPTPSSGSSSHTKSTIDAIIDWGHKTIQGAPTRCTPLVFADVNSDMGLVGRGSQTTPVASNSVGTVGLRRESHAGMMFRRMLEMEHMIAVNTFHMGLANPTYFGADNHSSRIDFIGIPDSLDWSFCKVLASSGRRLQPIPDTKARDHWPIMLRFPCLLHFEGKEQHSQWDQDVLMLAWRSGYKCADFIDDLEKTSEATSAKWFAAAQLGTPDSAWEDFVADAKTSAEKFFSKEVAKQDDTTRQHKEERLRLLKQRGDVRASEHEREAMRERLKAVDKELKRSARKWHREQQQHYVETLEEAQRLGRTATVYKMVRKLAGGKFGSKKRRYDTPGADCPGKEEWQEALAAEGVEGGMRAHFVEDWEQEEEEYRSESFFVCDCFCFIPKHRK